MIWQLKNTTRRTAFPLAITSAISHLNVLSIILSPPHFHTPTRCRSIGNRRHNDDNRGDDNDDYVADMAERA
jgi:hypothetical protein